MPVVKLRTRAPLERTDCPRGCLCHGCPCLGPIRLLLLMLSVAAGGPSAFAAGGSLETVPSSNYTALRGRSLFLLSDAELGGVRWRRCAWRPLSGRE